MYHTGLSASMIKREVCPCPRRPGPCGGLAKALDEKAFFIASHRDYTTWLARVRNTPVLVMSSGMGGPCVTFAVEANHDAFRVSIKRVPSPDGTSHPPGRSSNCFPRPCASRYVPRVRAPSGHFHIDQSSAPVVLIARHRHHADVEHAQLDAEHTSQNVKFGCSTVFAMTRK